MGTKTPVSILQEMMARLGAPPKYDLIFDGSGTHSTIFTYKVYAGDVTAIGSGRSKKEAKHEAARLALDRIAAHQIEAVPLPGVQKEHVEVVTPYKDQLKENAIGALHDMCATNEIPMPDYQLIDEKGAPHDKIFTFLCSVSKQREIGVGRTKKQAKQLAAFNMMNRLKDSLGDVLLNPHNDIPTTGHNTNEDLDNAAARYVAAVGTPKKKLRLNRNPFKYHKYFLETSEEVQIAACEALSCIDVPKTRQDCTDRDTDWMAYLKTILDCLDVQTTISQGIQTDQGKETVFLHVYGTSEAVFYGAGVDIDNAVQQAALLGLMFFKIQLYNVKKKLKVSD